MKCFGKIAVCLAGGLALNAGLRAAEPAKADNPPPDNPYAAIASRNIFGLVPPAPPPDPALDAEKSLPKITPTGIMGVFGNWQVLFKVAPAGKPGPAAKDDFYILSEGQRQDDIEVVKIDEKNSLVTFDNHGITQELPLADPSASGASATSSSGGGMNPAMPALPGGAGNGGIIRFGAGPGGRSGSAGFGGRSGPGNPGGAPGGPDDGANLSDAALPKSNLGPAQDLPPISAEQQAVIIAAEHLKALQDNDPSAPLFPPTPIDHEAGIDNGPPAP